MKLNQKPISTYSIEQLIQMEQQIQKNEKGFKNAQKINNELVKRGVK